MHQLLSTATAAALLLASSTAFAETYYVAPGGDDSASGLDGSPWQTLQNAAESVAPGDEVRVADGSYAGFQLETSGTAAAPIIVRATGSGAVIDSDGPTGDGVRLQNVSYVTVEGFTIVGSTERGVAHRGALATDPSVGLTIRNNTVRDAGREGMYLSQVSDSLVEGNTVQNAGVSGADRTHCIYLSNAGSDGTTLRGNHLFECGTAGIHFNGDLSIGGDGIISGVTVENNHIHDNGQNGLNMDGVQDALVQNNVIYDNGGNGLRAYAIDGAEGPQNLVIVNNTFRSNGWCVRITEDLGGSVVFNNIMMSPTGSIALDNTSGFASGYNAVVDTFTPDRDDTYWTLAEWQTAGYGEGSFLANEAELFSNEFRPASGGPAVDAGVSSFEGNMAPLVDREGTARDASPDIGAYEFCEGDCEPVVDPDMGNGPPDMGGPTGTPDGGTMTADMGSNPGGGDLGPESPAINPPNDSEGCCRVVGSRRGSTSMLALLLFGLFARRKR